MESRLNEFKRGVSPLYTTIPNPQAMDGGNMTHSYDDNDLIARGYITTATNAGGKNDAKPSSN
jgi:hypothetical protein